MTRLTFDSDDEDVLLGDRLRARSASKKRKGRKDGDAAVEDERQEEEEEKKKKKKVKEIRAANYRRSANKEVQVRIDRAFDHRLFLLEATTVDTTNRKYDVMGHSGNVYTVTICCSPSCTCPDFTKRRTSCKHILFILLRVLKAEKTDPVVWQVALLQSELVELFANADEKNSTLHSRYVMADKEVVDAYKKIQSGKDPASDDKNAKQRELEGDCSICFEELVEQKEHITFCKSCGNNFHAACISAWKKRSPSCPLCRGNLDGQSAKDAAGGSGYTNLKQFSSAHADADDDEIPYRSRYSYYRGYDSDC